MEEIRLFYKFKKNLHFVTALLRNFTGFFQSFVLQPHSYEDDDKSGIS